MARDRQRAKQRQQRRQSSGGSDASRKKSRARDAGVDDPRIEETPATDPVAAPDPLKKASAEVELAKAAETGVEPSGPAEETPLGGVQDAEPEPVDEEVEALEEEEPYDEDFEHAEDESEDDRAHADRAHAEVSLTKKDDHHPEHRKDRARFITFLGNCWEELKRVQWPNRRQVGQATAVVLGFVVLAGGYLGLMDAIWKPIVNAII